MTTTQTSDVHTGVPAAKNASPTINSANILKSNRPKQDMTNPKPLKNRGWRETASNRPAGKNCEMRFSVSQGRNNS